MANVRLAPVLRASAGGSKVVSVQGSTLSEVLSDLFWHYPALREQIQAEHRIARTLMRCPPAVNGLCAAGNAAGSVCAKVGH